MGNDRASELAPLLWPDATAAKQEAGAAILRTFLDEARAEGAKTERERIVALTKERGQLILGDGTNYLWNSHWALLTSHAEELAEGITIETIRARSGKEPT